MDNYETKKREVYRTIRRNGKKKYFTPVIATDIVTGESTEFECVMDAERAGFANHRNIFACLYEGRITAGGYYWRKAVKED